MMKKSFYITIKKNEYGDLMAHFKKGPQDPIYIDIIPPEEFHPFWGEYRYTHAGRNWRRAAEYISDLKKQGHIFQEGQRFRVPLEE